VGLQCPKPKKEELDQIQLTDNTTVLIDYGDGVNLMLPHQAESLSNAGVPSDKDRLSHKRLGGLRCMRLEVLRSNARVENVTEENLGSDSEEKIVDQARQGDDAD
jgi:hypothetical protein